MIQANRGLSDENAILVNDSVLIITGAGLIERVVASIDHPVSSLQESDNVAASPAPSAPNAAILTMPDGDRVTFASDALIGRAPQASDGAVTVVVDNPRVSSTHVQLELTDGQLVVTDLSTNGTMLDAPDEPRQLLTKGEPAGVQAGSTLWLTDDLGVVVDLVAPS